MKLFELNSACNVRLLEKATTPIDSPPIPQGVVLAFKRIDGMYSHCINEAGNQVYPAAWTEVEIVDTNILRENQATS